MPDGVKPITPKEAAKKKDRSIPDEIIAVVNKLIIENLNSRGDYAKVLQKDILAAVKNAPFRNEIFEKNYMDFEPLYRKAGWKVTYDKPGYNESGEAYFIFEKSRKM